MGPHGWLGARLVLALLGLSGIKFMLKDLVEFSSVSVSESWIVFLDVYRTTANNVMRIFWRQVVVEPPAVSVNSSFAQHFFHCNQRQAWVGECGWTPAVEAPVLSGSSVHTHHWQPANLPATWPPMPICPVFSQSNAAGCRDSYECWLQTGAMHQARWTPPYSFPHLDSAAQSTASKRAGAKHASVLQVPLHQPSKQATQAREVLFTIEPSDQQTSGNVWSEDNQNYAASKDVETAAEQSVSSGDDPVEEAQQSAGKPAARATGGDIGQQAESTSAAPEDARSAPDADAFCTPNDDAFICPSSNDPVTPNVSLLKHALHAAMGITLTHANSTAAHNTAVLQAPAHAAAGAGAHLAAEVSLGPWVVPDLTRADRPAPDFSVLQGALSAAVGKRPTGSSQLTAHGLGATEAAADVVDEDPATFLTLDMLVDTIDRVGERCKQRV